MPSTTFIKASAEGHQEWDSEGSRIDSCYSKASKKLTMSSFWKPLRKSISKKTSPSSSKPHQDASSSLSFDNGSALGSKNVIRADDRNFTLFGTVGTSLALHQSATIVLETLSRQDLNSGQVLEIMKAFPKNGNIQERACASLTTLAKDRNHQATITSQGGITVILNAMRTHPNDPTMQGHGCSALGNLATLSQGNKATIAAEGGIETILAAMERHTDASVLQESACGFLFNLSFLKENKILIASLGGVEAIVRTMKINLLNQNLQQYAFCALWNLASYIPNIALIAKGEGVEAIVQGMMTHPTLSMVQRSACGALRALSIDHESKNLIFSAGGVPALIRAMKLHPECLPVQKEACGAFRNLSQDKSIRELLLRNFEKSIASTLEAAAVRFPTECEDNADAVLRHFE